MQTPPHLTRQKTRELATRSSGQEAPVAPSPPPQRPPMVIDTSSPNGSQRDEPSEEVKGTAFNNDKYNPACTSPLNAKKFTPFLLDVPSGRESDVQLRRRAPRLGEDPFVDFFNAPNYHCYIFKEVPHVEFAVRKILLQDQSSQMVIVLGWTLYCYYRMFNLNAKRVRLYKWLIHYLSNRESAISVLEDYLDGNLQAADKEDPSAADLDHYALKDRLLAVYQIIPLAMELPMNREGLLKALALRSNSANLCCYSPRKKTNLLRMKSFEQMCHSCMRPIVEPEMAVMCAHLYFFGPKQSQYYCNKLHCRGCIESHGQKWEDAYLNLLYICPCCRKMGCPPTAICRQKAALESEPHSIIDKILYIFDWEGKPRYLRGRVLSYDPEQGKFKIQYSTNKCDEVELTKMKWFYADKSERESEFAFKLNQRGYSEYTVIVRDSEEEIRPPRRNHSMRVMRDDDGSDGFDSQSGGGEEEELDEEEEEELKSESDEWDARQHPTNGMKLEIRRDIRDEVKTFKKMVTLADPNEFVGQRVAVYWDLDEVWYLGTISSYLRKNKSHEILYDDNFRQEIILKNQTFLFEDEFLKFAGEPKKNKVVIDKRLLEVGAPRRQTAELEVESYSNKKFKLRQRQEEGTCVLNGFEFVAVQEVSPGAKAETEMQSRFDLERLAYDFKEGEAKRGGTASQFIQKLISSGNYEFTEIEIEALRKHCEKYQLEQRPVPRAVPQLPQTYSAHNGSNIHMPRPAAAVHRIPPQQPRGSREEQFYDYYHTVQHQMQQKVSTQRNDDLFQAQLVYEDSKERERKKHDSDLEERVSIEDMSRLLSLKLERYYTFMETRHSVRKCECGACRHLMLPFMVTPTTPVESVERAHFDYLRSFVTSHLKGRNIESVLQQVLGSEYDAINENPEDGKSTTSEEPGPPTQWLVYGDQICNFTHQML